MSLPKQKFSLSESLGMAIRLISDPKTWCKHSMGMTGNNHSVRADNPKAVKFCMLGSISRALHNQNLDAHTRPEFDDIAAVVQTEINKAYPNLGSITVAAFNDNKKTTHRDVMKVMNSALLTLQRKEGGRIRATATRARKARRRKN